MSRTFELDDLIRVAKRENNTKRSYLYVNPVQGKHIPVSPALSVDLFSQLAEKVSQRYCGEKLLIVGFAETATAIGSAIAYYAGNAAFYMNTTREDLPGAEYLFFTESHSHATEQRLVANALDRYVQEVDRIVFAEDEVTTGNTIEKIIRILQKRYAGLSPQFGIVSILNSMSDGRISGLVEEGIPCDYLFRIPTEYHVEEIQKYQYAPLLSEPVLASSVDVQSVATEKNWNCRVCTPVETVRREMAQFIEEALPVCRISERDRKILVLGTEECMFPGMIVGMEIEKRFPDAQVRFHATTRSPIEISEDEGYPLYNRTPLESIYGSNRRTFIYNLTRYDKVLIVTDAPEVNDAGLRSIVGALEQYGNTEILCIRWGGGDNEKQLF